MTGVVKRAITVRNDINNKDDLDNDLPLSDGVFVGETLYLSGRIGIDPATGRAATDAEREIRLMLDSVKAVLHEADMTMDDLSYVQIHCTDLSLFDVFNHVYRGYFSSQFPARAFLGANSLLLGARFEVCAIARRAVCS